MCFLAGSFAAIRRTMPMTEITPVSVAVENRSSQPPVEPMSERQMIQPVMDVPRIAPSTMEMLPHLHHTGVDKADDHDRCGGRGLDHRRYAGAQQKALDGITGQPVQNQLQFIARDLLQSVPHQGHAEQKQRDAAQQRDHIRNTHA